MSKEPNKNKSDVWQDERFSKLVGDPRFRNLSIATRKVRVDKRFESMFNDDSFKTKFTIDKYGRRINQVEKDDLKKYYKISSSESDDENTEAELAALKAENENDELATDGEFLSNELRTKLLESRTDFARGEGRILTDSSSDDESSDDGEMFIEHVWGELDADAPKTNETTYRLAACNMDWDRLRASDIMVLCNSFLPPGGSILSVKIYVSEYGKERLKQEDILGPIEMRDGLKKNEEIASDSETLNDEADDGDEFEMEKLRQYQLNRLKYYYAVIECNSKETADKLYTECDGLEYESTATKLDLRFIPDNEKFYAEEIKDECMQLPDLVKYKPRLFTTTALQLAKVELTWDETSTERKELSSKLVSGKYDEVNDQDLKQIICCSSSEGDDSDHEISAKEFIDQNEKTSNHKTNKISKYKSLLEEINKKESDKNKNKYEMEYSWGINVKTDKPNENKNANNTITFIEKILDKKKESRKRKKLMKHKNGDNSADYLPDGIDLNDPYFAEEFAGKDFLPLNVNESKNKHKLKNSTSEITDEQPSKELELLLDDDDRNQHFSLEKIMKSEKNKKKNKLKKPKKEIDKTKNQEEIEDFKINTQDERFKDVYESHLYNIDPSDPHFKNTKGMQTIIEEKMKRIKTEDNAGIFSRNNNQSKEKLKDSILIKNIKRKINK